MNRWYDQFRTEPLSAPADISDAQTWPRMPMTPSTTTRARDPNAPDYRYQVNQKCVYERRLPGGSYITAHVQRLQSGYYDSPVIHEDTIDNVRFVAINFVFHPSSTTFRFKCAEIRIALHHSREDTLSPLQVVAGAAQRHTSHDHGTQTMSSSLMRNPSLHSRSDPRALPPKFLRHAPHLLYGSISPETLNWNFNLAGSLGVSQGPALASIKPSYGVKSSYKVYEMMKIQGSVRTLRSWYSHEYDIEDGEMVWTLEENRLQKSGLPREFTFVMLLTKGSGGFEESGDVKLEVDIQPKIASFPEFISNLHRYQPLQTGILDLDRDIGQVFEPQVKGKGFNFANIATSFDDFVYLPGTTYSNSDTGMFQPTTNVVMQSQHQKPVRPRPSLPLGDTTLNLRVFLESSRDLPIQTSKPNPSCINLKAPTRTIGRTPSLLPPSVVGSSNSTRRTITISARRSVRKQRSRSELSKEYHSPSAGRQTLQQTDDDTPTSKDSTAPVRSIHFSYQAGCRDHSNGPVGNAKQEKLIATPPEAGLDSRPEFKTQPLHTSQRMRQPLQLG
ncbi:uncharacterized protein PV06_07358 [Exophiala oligosperma]|uniref:Uncharacterized protein n=1 Tax=Exophiala oligosperma TaxID=215243 RepID=A0A0D2DCF9_9EURO|nr:uncharacterized protein PV06_07358 [Exophiala oligosperma]KIW40130.1 hypothetical protein PV06_07358 [Exophiala oligosperma]